MTACEKHGEHRYFVATRFIAGIAARQVAHVIALCTACGKSIHIADSFEGKVVHTDTSSAEAAPQKEK